MYIPGIIDSPVCRPCLEAWQTIDQSEWSSRYLVSGASLTFTSVSRTRGLTMSTRKRRDGYVRTHHTPFMLWGEGTQIKRFFKPHLTLWLSPFEPSSFFSPSPSPFTALSPRLNQASSGLITAVHRNRPSGTTMHVNQTIGKSASFVR